MPRLTSWWSTRRPISLKGTFTQIRAGSHAWYWSDSATISGSVSVVSSTDTSPVLTAMISRMRSPRSASGASLEMMRGFVVTPESTPQAKRSLISLGSELSTKRAIEALLDGETLRWEVVFSSTRPHGGPRAVRRKLRAAWRLSSSERDHRAGHLDERGAVNIGKDALGPTHRRPERAQLAAVRSEDERRPHARGAPGPHVALAVTHHPRSPRRRPEPPHERRNHPPFRLA